MVTMLLCLWCALIRMTHFDFPTALSPKQMTLTEMESLLSDIFSLPEDPDTPFLSLEL